MFPDYLLVFNNLLRIAIHPVSKPDQSLHSEIKKEKLKVVRFKVNNTDHVHLLVGGMD